MAKMTNNIIMLHTSGMIGKQVVFKTRAGEMYVCAPPRTDNNRIPTPNQQSARLHFKQSIVYAKNAVKDPETKAAYRAVAGPGQTAYNMALRDAYNGPEVHSVITQGYRGNAGDIIVIHADDDFKVAAVRLSIYNLNNELIEDGAAVTNNDGLLWIYSATVNNLNIAGTRVKATAIDLPGNEAVLVVKCI